MPRCSICGKKFSSTSSYKYHIEHSVCLQGEKTIVSSENNIELRLQKLWNGYEKMTKEELMIYEISVMDHESDHINIQLDTHNVVNDHHDEYDEILLKLRNSLKDTLNKHISDMYDRIQSRNTSQ